MKIAVRNRLKIEKKLPCFFQMVFKSPFFAGLPKKIGPPIFLLPRNGWKWFHLKGNSIMRGFKTVSQG